MKTHSYKSLALASAMFAVALSTQAAPSANDILTKHVEAIGGVKANKKITTRVIQGSLKMPALGETEATVTIYTKAPDKIVSLIKIPNAGPIKEGYDGKVAWAQTPFAPVTQKTGALLKQAKEQSNFYRPIDYKTGYSKWEYGGERKLDGKAAHVLKGTTDDGRTETYYLDKKTLMILKAEIPIVSPSGPMNTVTTFSDYRKVDGVVLPHKINMIEPLAAVFTIEITEIKQNVKVEDSLFTKPTQ
jgi:outer membrane lipoprotein-sorting protein